MHESTTQIEIAIVGGGIVGAVLAVGLTKQGHKVKVYEQARGCREIGAGLAFTACARRCMGMIDPAVMEAFNSCGAVGLGNADPSDPNDYLSYVDGYNQHDPDDPDSELPLAKIDAGYRGFAGTRRDLLLEALVRKLPEGVIEFSKRLESVQEGDFDEKTLLTFTDGTTARADAIIGCDGLKSRVRQHLFGKGNPISYPHYSGAYAIRGLVTMPDAVAAIGEAKAGYFTMHLGSGANILHYPVANGTMVNVVAFITDTGDEDWTDTNNLVKPATRADLEQVLAKHHPAVRALASVFPERTDKWGLFDHWEYPAPFYSRRNICLVGDAAHASTPHHGAGAGMGMEDAACISALIGEAALTLRKGAATKEQALTAAFQAFDAARRTRCSWFVESSRRVCEIFHSKDWGNAFSRAQVRLEEVKDRSQKIWHYQPDKMVEGAIKDYLHRLSLSRVEAADILTPNGKQAYSHLGPKEVSYFNGNGISKPNGVENSNAFPKKDSVSGSNGSLDVTEPNGGDVATRDAPNSNGFLVLNGLSYANDHAKANGVQHDSQKTNGSLNNDFEPLNRVAHTNGANGTEQPNGVAHTNGVDSTEHTNGVALTNGVNGAEHNSGVAITNGHAETDQSAEVAINKDMANANAIPTVDISPWLDPNASQDAKDDIVKQVHDACSIYGFFNLRGHGVSTEAQERVKAAARKFFALPMEEKMKVSVDKSMGKSFRGFEPPLLQQHRNSTRPDTKETFITGWELPADDPDSGNFSTGPNLWPDSLPDNEFREHVMEYRCAMIKLAEVMIEILGKGLPKEWGCGPNPFEGITQKPSTPMRLLHYPAQEKVDPEQFGVGDHADFGCIALLLQEPGTRGLEVFYPPSESWIEVPVVADGYVFNIGDTMHRWTNGHYRSARHRVRNYTGAERYSTAWFLNGNLKKQFRPLDGSSDEETSISEFIRAKLAYSMPDAKFLAKSD